ncbi:MAG TPA: sulfotransferase [Terriglobia bacterium]|nr:sulfotransferase [Terriglobia bacterium]
MGQLTERTITRARGKSPVFVVGCPRSGTTLLYHMILSSGNFAVYRTESNAFNLLGPKFGDLGVLRNRQKLMDRWLQSMLFTRSGLVAEEIRAKVINECRSPGDFLRIMMEEICRQQKVDRWADCTPTHLLYLREIKESIPDARVIHIIRDGRDVALSYVRQGWVHPFPWDRKRKLLVAGLFWEWMVRKGRENGQEIGADYSEVRYEDLVASPRETLAKLGQFIDHDLDYDRILASGIGSVREANTSFAGESPTKGFNPLSRWKDKFDAGQLRSFEALVGTLLVELGYPLASLNLKGVNLLPGKCARALYFLTFASKHWLKSNTPLGSLLLDTTTMGIGPPAASAPF